MAIQVSYPGVYIEEFAPGAPIDGVGTSTVAFIGCTVAWPESVPLGTPVKVTSWDSFLKQFGKEPLDGFYLWYAVRGFFENGGRVCYVLRISNGQFAKLVLNDRTSSGGKATVLLQAKSPGVTSNSIQITTAEAHAVTTTLFKPSLIIESASSDVIKVKSSSIPDITKFLPGNMIKIEATGKTDSVVIVSIENDLIRFSSNLSNNYILADNATLRLADLKANSDNAFRVLDGANLVRGSVITLSQNPGGGAPVIKETSIVQSVSAEHISPALTSYRVILKKMLTKNFDLSTGAQPINLESQEFSLTVKQGTTYTSPYSNLSMDPDHPNYFAAIINNDSDSRIKAALVEPPSTTPPPDNRPKDYTNQALVGGADENIQTLGSSDYIDALRLLEAIDDINIIAIPDRTDAGIQQAMIAHCEKMQDRFAILDSRRDAPLSGGGSIVQQRHSVDSKNGFAALYYPWLKVAPFAGSNLLLVPPSGHMAGIYSRIDNSRGVHKAPAGTEAIVNGALGVELLMSDIDQGELNKNFGINVIRIFQAGGRPVVWGARTTATDKNWQYVNIRRLFLFLEESIQEGINWAVFEPNNLALWGKLKRTIRAFLMTQWRDGALFGKTAEEAFYIRIDEVLNPFSEQALGRLTIEIGVRPSYPAEFIVVRIGIWQGGSDVSEV